MTFTGLMRVYFNRHGAAPNVWCIAPEPTREGPIAWELAVALVSIEALCSTRYEPKATPDAEDGLPSAFISVNGTLVVNEYGIAVIR